MNEISDRIVIVGGGFAGLAVAARLAQEHLPVTLLEAAKLGFHASSRNQGWLHSGAWFAPREVEFAQRCYESLERTMHFCPECLEPGHSGMLFFASQPDFDVEPWTSAWASAGIPFREATAAAVADHLPAIDRSLVHHAFILPDRGMRPTTLLQKLADTAVESGVEIHTGTRVTGLLIEDEAVVGVRTTRGDELKASLVILATGAGAELWGQTTSDDAGAQERYRRVALQAHLVASTPRFGDWPFAVLDGHGFNHIPHLSRDEQTSVFGVDRWLVVAPTDSHADPAEFELIQGEMERFLTGFSAAGAELRQWRGITVQAMDVDQIEPGRVPRPTVIDHAKEHPQLLNLLSVYPGRATLWVDLAEQARQMVLERFERSTAVVERPPWETGGAVTASGTAGE